MAAARVLQACGWLSLFLFLALGLDASEASAAGPAKYWVFIGTSTGNKQSKGIYRATFDAATGKLSQPELAAEVDSPTFLAIHPTKKFLYAASSNNDRKQPDTIVAYALDAKTGNLKKLNEQPAEGTIPCHLVVDATGKHVLVASYDSGSVAVLPIEEDGSLGPATEKIKHKGKAFDAKRQQGPHAHSINLDKANRYAVVADLGLDRLFIYKFDPKRGKLEPNEPAATKVHDRAGPRHFAFHPDGKHAYVINEIDCTVTAFDYDSAKGTLTEIQTIPTMPIPVEPKHSTAEVVVHPSGKFLYGSNRGHDSLAVYSIDPRSGKLKLVEYEPTSGKTPRNFAVDPTGAYVLAENMSSNTIVVFKVDPATGALEPTGDKVDVPSPNCVKFVPIAE